MRQGIAKLSKSCIHLFTLYVIIHTNIIRVNLISTVKISEFDVAHRIIPAANLAGSGAIRCINCFTRYICDDFPDYIT